MTYRPAAAFLIVSDQEPKQNTLKPNEFRYLTRENVSANLHNLDFMSEVTFRRAHELMDLIRDQMKTAEGRAFVKDVFMTNNVICVLSSQYGQRILNTIKALPLQDQEDILTATPNKLPPDRILPKPKSGETAFIPVTEENLRKYPAVWRVPSTNAAYGLYYNAGKKQELLELVATFSPEARTKFYSDDVMGLHIKRPSRPELAFQKN